jgi:hypothetical protein
MSTNLFSTRGRKAFASVALVAAASMSMAACGSSDDSSSTSSAASTEKASAPKPVASIDSLTGNDTQVTLDQGFFDALTTLKLTPGVVGTAKLTDGALVFPITGGNVTVFKPGQVSPYVIGQIQHEGSGLSLAAGGTKVEISPVAAPLLNKTFKTDAVKAGLLVGIAKITVSTTPGD